MALPAPEPGLVIPYAYLWKREYRRGLEEGRKTRPAIILSVFMDRGALLVELVAITHSPPQAGDEAIEMPATVKRHLGLDDARSWIVLDELNRFAWPGYDVGFVPGVAGLRAYGFVPPSLFGEMRSQIVKLAKARRLIRIPRD